MALSMPFTSGWFTKFLAGAFRQRLPDQEDGEFELMRDLPYLDTGNDKHKLNLYVPHAVTQSADEKLHPIVVHVHGGGWKRGGRDASFYGGPYMARSYAEQGFVSIAISYRLSVRHPQHVEDVAAALRWVYDHAHEFRGDRDRIFLSGHSAGGHLVTLITTDPQYAAAQGLPSDVVKGVVAISGVYNLYNPLSLCDRSWKSALYRRAYIRSTFGSELADMNQASPYNILLARAAALGITAADPAAPAEAANALAAAQLGLPPMLIINAGVDMGLEIDGERFYKALVAHGCTAERLMLGESNHASVTKSPITVAEATKFIRKRLELLDSRPAASCIAAAEAE